MAKATETKPEASSNAAPGSLAADIASAVAGMEALNVVETPEASLPEGFDPAQVPTIAEARDEAKGKGQGLTRELLERPLVFVSWRPQRGMIQATGEYKPGFFCVIMDVQTKKVHTLWLGNVALCRELRRVKPPFRAKITTAGRTLVFA